VRSLVEPKIESTSELYDWTQLPKAMLYYEVCRYIRDKKPGFEPQMEEMIKSSVCEFLVC
jgi:hypothetical protein